MAAKDLTIQVRVKQIQDTTPVVGEGQVAPAQETLVTFSVPHPNGVTLTDVSIPFYGEAAPSGFVVGSYVEVSIGWVAKVGRES